MVNSILSPIDQMEDSPHSRLFAYLMSNIRKDPAGIKQSSFSFLPTSKPSLPIEVKTEPIDIKTEDISFPGTTGIDTGIKPPEYSFNLEEAIKDAGLAGISGADLAGFTNWLKFGKLAKGLGEWGGAMASLPFVKWYEEYQNSLPRLFEEGAKKAEEAFVGGAKDILDIAGPPSWTQAGKDTPLAGVMADVPWSKPAEAPKSYKIAVDKFWPGAKLSDREINDIVGNYQFWLKKKDDTVKYVDKKSGGQQWTEAIRIPAGVEENAQQFASWLRNTFPTIPAPTVKDMVKSFTEDWWKINS